MDAALIETPTLVIGGGPVGLALATDLGWRKIPSILIEQGDADARLAFPRMDNVGIRTMEFARRWGIVSDIEQAGFPTDLPTSIVYTTAVLGHELARDVYSDKASAEPPPFSPQKHELCPQNFFDPVMQRAASAYPGNQILYGHRLVGVDQAATHVAADIERLEDGHRFTIKAEYLAACDGAGSATAKMLGLASADERLLSCSTNIFVRCPGLAHATRENRAYRYILIAEHGVWATMVNIDGRDVWRLQLIGGDFWPAWSDAEIQAFVLRGIGQDIPFEVVSWAPWARRELVVEQFRAGRCFLVGDSAHQFSPTGGYGMNTGIAEAVDLSWKIAATLEGWGGDALLDSYDAERRPVAIRNARQASENLAAMRSVQTDEHLLDGGEIGDAARRSIGVSTQTAMRREWRSFGIHLGSVYRKSPIVSHDEDSTPECDVADFVQSAQPGARAPHIWIKPGRSTLDLFGASFVLLDLTKGASDNVAASLLAAARARNMPMQHEILDSEPARILYERRYALIRPDGHVAWRGDTIPADPGALLDMARGALNVPGGHAASPKLKGAEYVNQPA